MKSISIGPSKSAPFYYVIISYSCISLLIFGTNNLRMYTALLYVFLIFLFFLFLLITKDRLPTFRRRRNKKARKISLSYEKSISLSMMSALTFLSSIVSHVFLKNIFVSSCFYVLSIIFVFIATNAFLSESEHFEKVYRGCILWMLRLAWLITSFATYYYSRHMFMELADLTFDQTATRLVVIAYAAFFSAILVLSSAMFMFFIAAFFEHSRFTISGKLLLIKRDSSPLIFSALLISLSTFYFISYNIKPIFNYVFSYAIPLDTTRTFTCNNIDKIIKGNITYHYFYVSKDRYRVFYFSKNGFEVKRLECISVAPFYSISDIKSFDDIVFENLKSITVQYKKDHDALLKK